MLSDVTMQEFLLEMLTAYARQYSFQLSCRDAHF